MAGLAASAAPGSRGDAVHSAVHSSGSGTGDTTAPLAPERGDGRLRVEVVPGGGLVLHGRVDGVALPDLRAALRTAVLDGAGELAVDVAGVTLVEAAGLGVLLEAHRRCHRAGRRLVLTGVGADLARLLFVTRLSRVLDVRAAEPAQAGALVAEATPAGSEPPARPAPPPRIPSS